MHHIDIEGQGPERGATGVGFGQREFAKIDPVEACVLNQRHQSRLLIGVILEALATFAGHTRQFRDNVEDVRSVNDGGSVDRLLAHELPEPSHHCLRRAHALVFVEVDLGVDVDQLARLVWIARRRLLQGAANLGGLGATDAQIDVASMGIAPLQHRTQGLVVVEHGAEGDAIAGD